MFVGNPLASCGHGYRVLRHTEFLLDVEGDYKGLQTRTCSSWRNAWSFACLVKGGEIGKTRLYQGKILVRKRQNLFLLEKPKLNMTICEDREHLMPERGAWPSFRSHAHKIMHRLLPMSHLHCSANSSRDSQVNRPYRMGLVIALRP